MIVQLSDQMKKIRIVKMQHTHVAEVVNIYASLFTGLLSDLGKKWLTLYIREFCNHDYDISAVAVEENSDTSQVVGFIIGSKNVSSHNKEFLSNHFFLIAAIFSYKFLTRKSIRMTVMKQETRKKFIRIFKNVSRVAKKENFEKNIRPNAIYIMFTAVINDFRGTGVAENLFEHFEETIKESGITEGRLRVHSENICATRFYSKMGWRQDASLEENAPDSNWLYYVKRY